VDYIEWGFAENSGISVLPAKSDWYIFVQKCNGEVKLGISGPMTKALFLTNVAGTECFGIHFRLGSFLPQFPINVLIDQILFLPEATGSSFWLNGSVWELPTFENADTFVNRLVREEILVGDPVINAALANQPQDVSPRTIRRRFLRATGLAPSTVRQIERARRAMKLLEGGVSILDTIYEAGYFDQPHLTRSLKHFMGITPAQVTSTVQSE
jgi:hypothetical protein